ncbi:hypothetical protein HPB50_014369 [Hyalomma asiaticum]|uniref:Uncharacterized protein n=1 Tax=Hyalomma asiaticum TaxID=266040 RepID=A0ACB7TKA5_HYAAI|nr:hypothetical protein HPB50_014369 [Hyalomma asiaticum]
MSLEALALGQITDMRINSRKNVLAIDANQGNVLYVLSNVKALENINVRSYIPDGKDSTEGLICDVHALVKATFLL